MITQILWLLSWPVSILITYYLVKWALKKTGLYNNPQA
jgi:hypothetical protein